MAIQYKTCRFEFITKYPKFANAIIKNYDTIRQQAYSPVRWGSTPCRRPQAAAAAPLLVKVRSCNVYREIQEKEAHTRQPKALYERNSGIYQRDQPCGLDLHVQEAGRQRDRKAGVLKILKGGFIVEVSVSDHSTVGYYRDAIRIAYAMAEMGTSLPKGSFPILPGPG
jgi:hypothetical protein